MNTNQNKDQKAQTPLVDQNNNAATKDQQQQDGKKDLKTSPTGSSEKDRDTKTSELDNPGKEHTDKNHEHESKIPVAGINKEKDTTMKEDQSETKPTSGAAQGKVNLDPAKKEHQKSSI